MQWIADEHWSEDEPQSQRPLSASVARSGTTTTRKANTLYVRNGKMLRLKTAEIGYTYKIMRVYVSGTNLLTFVTVQVLGPRKGFGQRPELPAPTDVQPRVPIQLLTHNTATDHEKDNLIALSFLLLLMLMRLPRRRARRQGHARRTSGKRTEQAEKYRYYMQHLHAQPDRIRLVARPVRRRRLHNRRRAARPTGFPARASSTARRTPMSPISAAGRRTARAAVQTTTSTAASATAFYLLDNVYKVPAISRRRTPTVTPARRGILIGYYHQLSARILRSDHSGQKIHPHRRARIGDLRPRARPTTSA